MKLKRASFPNGVLTQDASLSVVVVEKISRNEQRLREQNILEKISIFRFLVIPHLLKENLLLSVFAHMKKQKILHTEMSFFIISRL